VVQRSFQQAQDICLRNLKEYIENRRE
jgi:hypothetical protein